MTPSAAILLVFLSPLYVSSASSAVDTPVIIYPSSCFVVVRRAATAASTTPVRPRPPRARDIPARIIVPPPATRLSLSLSNNDPDGKSRKFSRDTKTRIPRHQEEAAGITTSLGLWRTTGRLRHLIKEGWDSLQSKRTGRRRRKLASRFKSYFLGDDSSSTTSSRTRPEDYNPAIEGIDSDIDDGGGMDDDIVEISLDAVIARAGVLRTRIRLRQESLSTLERLMTDLRLELRRTGWKNVFDANAGSTKRTVFMYGQGSVGDDAGDADTDEVMNEFELTAINRKWKEQISKGSRHPLESRAHDATGKDADNLLDESQYDRMRQRSSKLQSSILLDTMRLQRLERRIVCLENDELGILERAVGNTLGSLNDLDSLLDANPTIAIVRQRTKKFLNTLYGSTSVLLRKLDRVSSGENRDYTSLKDFVVQETAAGVRIIGNLLSNPSTLAQLVDPDTPTLVPHVPAMRVSFFLSRFRLSHGAHLTCVVISPRPRTNAD